MENKTSDNKYCVQKQNVIEIPHLDWLELSIWSSFAGVSYFIQEINKNLFQHFGFKLEDKYGNQRYFDSLRSEDFGISLFHNVRNNVKNAPLFLSITGRFFRYARHVEFITWLLGFLNALHETDFYEPGHVEKIKYTWRPTRIDSSIDFVSFGETFIPYPRFKSISGSALREFTSVFRGNSLSSIFHGKDGCKGFPFHLNVQIANNWSKVLKYISMTITDDTPEDKYMFNGISLDQIRQNAPIKQAVVYEQVLSQLVEGASIHDIYTSHPAFAMRNQKLLGQWRDVASDLRDMQDNPLKPMARAMLDTSRSVPFTMDTLSKLHKIIDWWNALVDIGRDAYLQVSTNDASAFKTFKI